MTLILANLAMLLLGHSMPRLEMSLALVPALVPARPWTLVTYMFLHAGFAHLFFNMLALYFFGPRLEARLGGRRFIALYLISGVSGALLSIFTPFVAIVGASGAVFGVMLGFAHFWPREPIYIWGLLRIEARVLVVLMTALALFGAWSPGQSGIAHFAHLGGFLGGFLYLRWIELRSPAVQFRARAAAPPPRRSMADMERWRRIRPDALHPVNREEYERVMAKVELTGVASLTADERAFLDRFSSG
jgi:membrane associated rhomboid family serine protease